MFKHKFVITVLVVSALFVQTTLAQTDTNVATLSKRVQELWQIVSQLQAQLRQITSPTKPVNYIGPPVREESRTSVTSPAQVITPDQSLRTSPLETTFSAPPVKESPKEWCHTFGNNLALGNRGGEVGFLQKVLEQEGFSIASEDKDAQYFGESTAAAVSGFQEKYRSEILDSLGLKYPTGFVGKSTRAKLNALYGCSVIPPGMPPKVVPPPPKVVPPPPTGKACPQYAKPCPDGSYVGPSGPNCEFICPGGVLPPDKENENKPPVILGVDGQSALQVNQKGTWTVKAYDPENEVLKYSVIWGDEPIQLKPMVQSPFSFQQTATFTHSYAKPGVYYPVFIVTDDKGLSAKTSVSVNVVAGSN